MLITACNQYCLAVPKLRDNTRFRTPARGTLATTTIKDKYELPRKHVFFIPGNLQYGY